ncbi:MAG TPA: hypothetical protein VIL65_05680 [Beijerinckiaceae bacterium]
MTLDQTTADDFNRLHRAFTYHLGIATGLAWLTALYAALYAPWVRNIRPLLDPSQVGRVESTWSFIFGMPVVLAVSWVVIFAGRDMLRHFKVMRNQNLEFALAGAAAFAIFYMAIDRAVAAMLLGLA